MNNTVFENFNLTERSLIESILASHYIIDYGFIKNVNPDKTIDVTHAKQLKTYEGKSLKPTVTQKVEVLTVSGGGFSIKFDYKKGDKVLLLGLKDYVKKVEDVTMATETTAYMHYSRETLKALPLCVFNEDAKVTVKIEDGELAIKTSGKVTIESNKDVEVTAKNITAYCSKFSVKAKGASAETPAALEVTP
jgi:hypothetical protein